MPSRSKLLLLLTNSKLEVSMATNSKVYFSNPSRNFWFHFFNLSPEIKIRRRRRGLGRGRNEKVDEREREREREKEDKHSERNKERREQNFEGTGSKRCSRTDTVKRKKTAELKERERERVNRRNNWKKFSMGCRLFVFSNGRERERERVREKGGRQSENPPQVLPQWRVTNFDGCFVFIRSAESALIFETAATYGR